MNTDTKNADWRTEWVWDTHLGLDWRDWGLGLHAGVRWGRNYGFDFQVGPIYCYVMREWGSYLYENGERQFGIGPV